jgi:hypothetical protein
MDEIIEGTVGTLHILAKEAQSRVMIRGLKCTPLFVQVCFQNELVCVQFCQPSMAFKDSVHGNF